MKLTGRRVGILPGEEGREMLRLGSIDDAPSPIVLLFVVESEDLGLWVQTARNGVKHSFLLRWEYILGIGVQGDQEQVLGWNR